MISFKKYSKIFLPSCLSKSQMGTTKAAFINFPKPFANLASLNSLTLEIFLTLYELLYTLYAQELFERVSEKIYIINHNWNRRILHYLYQTTYRVSASRVLAAVIMLICCCCCWLLAGMHVGGTSSQASSVLVVGAIWGRPFKHLASICCAAPLVKTLNDVA